MNDTPEQIEMYKATKSILNVLKNKSFEFGFKVLVTALTGLISELPKEARYGALLQVMGSLTSCFQLIKEAEKSGKV